MTYETSSSYALLGSNVMSWSWLSSSGLDKLLCCFIQAIARKKSIIIMMYQETSEMCVTNYVGGEDIKIRVSIIKLIACLSFSLLLLLQPTPPP